MPGPSFINPCLLWIIFQASSHPFLWAPHKLLKAGDTRHSLSSTITFPILASFTSLVFFGLLWTSSVILTDISSTTLRSPSQAVTASSEPSDFPPVHCFSFSSLEFHLLFYYLLTKYHKVLSPLLEVGCVFIFLVLNKHCHQMSLLLFLFSPRLTWAPQIQGSDAQEKACQY